MKTTKIKGSEVKKNKGMARMLLGAALLILHSSCFVSCKNGDAEFDDFEGGTTVYFAYQYPVRTIVLGDDEYDTTLDKAHKCQIQATFGGSRNGSSGSVQIVVDNSLVSNLTFADGTPVKAMPENYYQLSTNSLAFNGTFKGITEVQLTDAFFADPDAVQNTYVIPVVMTGQSGFGKILTGELNEGGSPIRTDESQWSVLPKDYVLYCVKFQNKYSGYWLTHHTTSTDNIEKAGNVQIRTKSLTQSVYTVSYQGKWVEYLKDDQGQTYRHEKDSVFTADLQLTFDASEQCAITSLTAGATATGTGSWGDDIVKKSWGDKDRDGMELNYTVSFGKDEDGNDHQWSTHEKLVWFRSGVKRELFSPVYTGK